MEQITEQIYLGSINDAIKPDLNNTVDVVLNVSSDMFLAGYGAIADVEKWNVIFDDGKYVDIALIEKAVGVIEKAVGEGKRILVHCTAGISRSPMVVACYLAKKKGIDFDQAMEHIARIRRVVCPDPRIRRSGIDYLQSIRQARW